MRPIVRRGRAAASAALAVGALLLSGCSGSGSGGTVQPGPAAATASGSHAGASPSGGADYSDSAAVISALNSAGHPCAQAAKSSATTASGAPGLKSVSACTVGSSKQVLTASVFDDHSDAQTYSSLLSQDLGMMLGGSSTRIVLGQNWVLLVPDDVAYANQAGSALGGSVLSASSS